MRRRPEEPHGSGLTSPAIARRLTWIAFGFGLSSLVLTVIAGAIEARWLGLLFSHRLHTPSSIRQVAGMILDVGIAVAIVVVGHGITAATGRRRLAGGLVAIGVVSVLLGIMGDMRHAASGWWWQRRFAGLGHVAAIAGLAGGLALATVAVPSPSPAMRRIRRVAAAILAIGGGAVVLTGLAAVLLDEIAPASPLFEGIFMVTLSLGALGVVVGSAACLAMGVIGHWMAGRRGRAAVTLPLDAVLAFNCPGCGTVREHGRGTHRCLACGTRARVVIEEPRCVCGYVLFRMSQETCPECGREVPEADRYTDARFRSMPGDAPAEHAPTRSEGAAPVAEGEDVVTPHDPQTDW